MEIYDAFHETFDKCTSGLSEIMHIIGNRDPFDPLSAPVTELFVAKIKPDITKEVASQHLAALSDSSYSSEAIAAGARGSTWGFVSGKEDYLGLIVGWTTPQASDKQNQYHIH